MTESGGGSIVNYASVWVVQPAPYTCAYGASKWAISGMTKCAAIELAPRGIRVNCIYGSGGSPQFITDNPIAQRMGELLAGGNRREFRRASTRDPVRSTPPEPRPRPARACSSRATRAPGTTAPTSPPAPS